jgi:predicted ATP-grasp superfamily ATP-dependent carboligase
MTDLYEFIERPDLDSPVLIVALEGWIDAGSAAARAAAAIVDGIEATTVVRFDADALLDHRSRRPVMRIDDGMNRGLRWPAIEMVAFSDAAGNDVLMLTGAEPDHQWRAFCRAVVDLALEFGVRMVVGLGAYPAPVPHTRPAQLASTSTDEHLVPLVGSVRSTIDVPAGIGNAIEERCAEVGLPAVGLWAQVPHYAATMPYPGGAVVLVEKVNELCQLSFPLGTVAEEAAATLARLDELVADSTEHVALLRQLEAQADQRDGASSGGLGGADRPGDLPSGDELATEIERFLRGQDNP